MRKIKLLAAFFLSAVMILVSGADSIRADTFFFAVVPRRV